jgi:hypothetical protein
MLNYQRVSFPQKSITKISPGLDIFSRQMAFTLQGGAMEG